MYRPVAMSPFSNFADGATRAVDLPVTCRVVEDRDELAIHFAIREPVFVTEQGFFEETDRDAHDDDPAAVHVLGLFGHVAGGAVRLYPLEPGLWQGDRLAVLAPFRAWNLGGPLVRFAVDTAAALGGTEMVAHVQAANVRFFERLGWVRRGEPEVYVGLPHQSMAIDLSMAQRRSTAGVTPVEDRSPARS